jgi:hypothetical protein
MNTERLLMLAELLEHLAVRLPSVTFDISQWARREQCGYSACAIGSACLYPPFNEMGLIQDGGTIMLGPKFGHHESWGAVREFFELTDRDARFLFEQDEYHDVDGLPDEIDVATRIREFVA